MKNLVLAAVLLACAGGQSHASPLARTTLEVRFVVLPACRIYVAHMESAPRVDCGGSAGHRLLPLSGSTLPAPSGTAGQATVWQVMF